MPAEWTDDLATGVELIDKQHKEIFRRINGLLEACRLGKGKEEVGKTIAFLEDYVVHHFAAEEKAQKDYAYPEYPQHKEIHDRFIVDFAGLKKRFDDEGATLSMVLVTNQVVTDWLINHINKIDKKLARYLQEKAA